MQSTFRALIAVAIAVSLAACQTMRPDEEVTSPQPETLVEPAVADQPVPSVIDELHEDIRAAVQTYREAVALLDEGSVETGSNMMEDSMFALDEAVQRCRSVAGCDLDLALEAYRTVLTMQESLFVADEDVEPRGDEAPLDGISGESAGSNRSLNGVDLAEQIKLNRHVMDAIHDWLTWKRPLLMATFENYRFMRQEMWPSYVEAGLPEALLFGILAVESGGKVHAYSRAGAAGPLQFMRATGRRYGLRDTNGFDQRFSPSHAAKASVAYLNDQFRQLDFSLEKTLAAYNGGENRLKRLNRRLDGADFWSSDFYYSLPSDTRRYVPDVLAAAWLFLHPEDYNLTFPMVEDQLTDLVLDRETSISEVTICLGNEELNDGWFRTLRNLNPHLDNGDRLKPEATLRVPQRVADIYVEKCTQPELIALAADLRDASESRESDLLPYVVRNGDTLSRIASRYRCMSMKELAAVNNIAAPRYFIRAGKTIKVPSC